ncbi:tRNA uridine(34) 5-carboxymethylaminomethyl modification radical SAM/GNAT enzyme Elp3, partial [bacterium]|nr:tRNA uridine(34) 5-carboxymethylaminomethyl modification radical SAM/GNAT enzyme Elp3 [bacterium]
PNTELLRSYHNLLKFKRIKRNRKLEELLKVKKIRSLSGIVNVSVLTKPYPCPGKCIYCPYQKGVPKSYLNNEPAVMRAILNKFDPFLQTQSRIRALKENGHPTDKIELRIIGGTWSFYPKRYQVWFLKRCFDACNYKKKQTNHRKIQAIASILRWLKRAQKLNETAKHRIVGLSIETRPDFINEKEIKWLRELGVTMVELGVQSIYDDVLKLNKRGHGVKATIEATKLLKDAGFKVLYQIMLNLPGSDLKKDKKMFEELFSNPDFQPDYLKIYPCALLKEAPLYRWWKEGKYKPYTKEQLISLIKSIKKRIPYYVRIQRIIRDIPSQSIVTGPAKISNLRQIITQQIKKENWKCHCIRCREVRENYNPKEKLYLFREEYTASEGKEIFLSFENKNREKLYSLLRLRIPSYCFKDDSQAIFSVLKNAAIIREVHTYGYQVPLNKKTLSSSPQHKGLGKKLIKEAERIVKKEFNLNKIAIISGIGVRSYYRKLGYRLKDTYMVKKI